MQPTPTPFPSNQLLQVAASMEKTIDSAVQQGVVGILLLLSIALVLYMIFQIIVAYVNRNKKPDNAAVNNAIEALAEMNHNRDEEARLDRDERRKEQEEWRKITHEQRQDFIDALSPIPDGYNRVGDILDNQTHIMQTLVGKVTTELDTMQIIRAELKQFAASGSIPLQQLIAMVAEMKGSLDKIKEDLLPSGEIISMRDEDRLLFQSRLEVVKGDIDQIKATIEKRKTDTDNIPIITKDQL